VIDNFFDNVDEIREYALSCEYFPPERKDSWRGFRTKVLERNSDVVEHIYNKINQAISSVYGMEGELDTVICFHYSTESTKYTCQPDFNTFKWHTDPARYPSIIYLTPNPPPHSGTTLRDEKRGMEMSFENVYNRFITYSGGITHAPADLFGLDINSSRLIITSLTDLSK
tara:strand:- start:66 stop:575 length:510 start_codon:yes stop_codon:yes gene_type:complete